MKHLIYLLFLSTFTFGQGKLVSNVDSLHSKNTTYKIQILSSSYIDKTKFKYFLEEYRCEVEYHRTKVGKDVYRYMITPKENNLCSANVLLDETFFHFQNPFIVVYYKGKRQN